MLLKYNVIQPIISLKLYSSNELLQTFEFTKKKFLNDKTNDFALHKYLSK